MTSPHDTPIPTPIWHPLKVPAAMACLGIDIWRLHLDRIEAETSLLSHHEMEKAKGRASETLSRRYIAARHALRTILGAYLAQTPQTLRFAATEKGKPYLDAHPELTFNLSHSDNLALLAITNGDEIGIDLEPITSRPHMGRIAKRIFNGEITDTILNASTESEQRFLFTREWTALEARQKMTGNGLFGDKSSPPHRLLQFHPAHDWLAAIAIANRDSDLETRYLDFKE
jgi:4'-phosphopantetheinyl transferase